MRRYLIPTGLALFVGLSLPTPFHAAEAIKLRPTAPIYVGGKGTGVQQPEGVGCGKSQLVVADTGNGRILRYAITGTSLTPVASIVLPQFPYPIRAQLDSKGEIYALDGKLRRIGRISPSGEFLGYVDLKVVAGGTVVPRSIRVGGDDNLYLLDIFSERVLVLDPAGKVQRTIPFPPEYGFFSDLAVDPGGRIFLIDSIGRRVYVATKGAGAFQAASESLEEHLNFPTSLAVDQNGNIFVIDQNGSGIVILGPDGSFRGRHLGMGWKDGFLRYPAQACIDENGNFFIANRGNNRIEVLSTTQ